MKTANLVIAILYTIILAFFLFIAFVDGDAELLIGTLMFTPPVIMNWISSRG